MNLTIASKETLELLMEADEEAFAKECDRYGTILEDVESITKVGYKRFKKYSIYGIIATVVRMKGEVWGVSMGKKYFK